MMLNKLKDIISEFSEVKDWTLYEINTDSQELYITLTENEAERNINTLQYTVILYLEKEIDGKKYTGTASRSFASDSNDEEIRKSINEVVFAASLALNQYYELPEYEKSDVELQICDKELIADKRKSIKFHTFVA